MDVWFWGVQYFLKLYYIVGVRGEVQRLILQCLGDSFQTTLIIIGDCCGFAFYAVFVFVVLF